jgi:hypothetical protein
MLFKRNRFIYFACVIIVMALGLTSRKMAVYLPEIMNEYLDDALWALMIYAGVATIFNRWEIKRVIIFALTFCYLIEISQLYHAPWIDTVRSTHLGGLVLGFGFLWSDLLAYSFGVGFGALIEWISFKNNH